MRNLPVTEPDLESHTKETSRTYTSGITNGRGTERKLTILLGDALGNFGESANVNNTSKKAFPKYDKEDDVYVRDKVEEGVEG